ncbi:MAG TPA: short-chain dehydrogenase [Cyanothece sp. UBA12306]|nr:short-chain dehydrogenase [Cyanothece sp. UBA12306]
MTQAEAQYLFSTLEGYEQFITDLLEHEVMDLTVDPTLNWEDALFNNNLLLN